MERRGTYGLELQIAWDVNLFVHVGSKKRGRTKQILYHMGERLYYNYYYYYHHYHYSPLVILSLLRVLYHKQYFPMRNRSSQK